MKFNKKIKAIIMCAALVVSSISGMVNVSANDAVGLEEQETISLPEVDSSYDRLGEADEAAEESDMWDGYVLEGEPGSESTGQFAVNPIDEAYGQSGVGLVDGNSSQAQTELEDDSISQPASINGSDNQILLNGASTENISDNSSRLTFEYTNPYRVFETYISADGNTAKVLYENELFSCNLKTGEFTLEYTFPKAEYKKDYNGGFYGAQSTMSAYIRVEEGLLYYAYNSYYNTYSEDEIANVIVYDLESNIIVDEIKLNGYTMNSVGADDKGYVYLATDNYYKDSAAKNTYELFVFSPAGAKVAQKKVEYSIHGFSGFCPDGTFYFIDEYMAYSAYGYENLMGRLMNGKFKNNTITINDTYMTYAKNIYFADYRTPVEIIGDKYLVTWNGSFYPLDKITDSSWSCQMVATKKLEMGSTYEYIYNIGVNSVLDGNDVYTTYDNDTIYVYDITTGVKKSSLDLTDKIVSLKGSDAGLVALMMDDEGYYYKKINKKDFKKVTTTTYIMNDFAPYKGRTKEKIVKRFSKAVPDNYYESVYASEGSLVAPYKEYVLSDKTKENAVKISNYYRWLAGLTGFKSLGDEYWSDAAKGAVLLSASNFSHSPAQPADMDDDFYASAVRGTSGSSIAGNGAGGQQKFIYTIRQFMNDNGYTVAGHRNTFLTRNGDKIAYGMTDSYICQTVEYDTDPNPSGMAVVDNNEAAYGWPAAGYFPAEDISTKSVWSVNLNTDKLTLSNVPLEVVITDLDTGEKFVRDSSETGLYATSFWGYFISFDPPVTDSTTYAGKRYKVEFKNLEDSVGMPAKLEYTVDFFSLNDKFVIDGEEYYCDKYGILATKEEAESGSGSESESESGSGDYLYTHLPEVHVSYRTHVQTFGWEGVKEDISTWKSNGTMSGTSGMAKRLEGINIVVDSKNKNQSVNLGIQYTTHCQSYGWLPWSANGDMNGTEGEAKRLEAIMIKLTGADAPYYDVYYRVHAQSYGWLNWAKNGEPAGTAGLAKRLEGIQIVVVKKGQTFNQNMENISSVNSLAYVSTPGASPVVNNYPTSNTNPFVPGEYSPNVSYRTHVQSYGWQGWKYNGQMSGTHGKAKRLEGININLTNKSYDGGIVYTTHVQTYGWQGVLSDQSTWKKNGEMAGTSGESKRLEAICINLTGDMARRYDIYYRVHAQSYGWLNWAKNGEEAGTAGYGKRLEGIQVVLVYKGGCAPGDYDGIVSDNEKAYIQK